MSELSGTQTPKQTPVKSTPIKTTDATKQQIIDFLTSTKGAILFVCITITIFAACILLLHNVSNRAPVIFGAGLIITMFSVFYYLSVKTIQAKKVN